MFDPKQVQQMQKELHDRMEKVQADLKTKRVEGSAGGGIIVAIANGNREIESITIKPEAIDPDDAEMLQDLVIAAVNLALEKSRALNEEEMSKVTGGIKIPGLL